HRVVEAIYDRFVIFQLALNKPLPCCLLELTGHFREMLTDSEPLHPERLGHEVAHIIRALLWRTVVIHLRNHPAGNDSTEPRQNINGSFEMVPADVVIVKIGTVVTNNFVDLLSNGRGFVIDGFIKTVFAG